MTVIERLREQDRRNNGAPTQNDATDLETLEGLVQKYWATARDNGVDLESVTIGEALRFLESGELS